MNNPHTGTVASALRKCQLLLVAIERCEDNATLERQALEEGALLQLWRAYKAFLAEQAHQLQLAVTPESAEDLHRYAAAAQKVSAEVQELLNLAENPDGWFAGLQRAWRGLWQSAGSGSGQIAVSAQSPTVNLIPMTEVKDAAPAPLTRESLQSWLRALSELVLRQRAQSVEW